MAAQHTAEPWTVEQDDFGVCDEDDTRGGWTPVGINGADGTPVVYRGDNSEAFWNPDQPDGDVAHANANRIVATVNGCVGFTTDELTSGVITALVHVAADALAVRRLQRAYFVDRTKDNLIASKEAERRLDARLAKVVAAITRTPVKNAP